MLFLIIGKNMKTNHYTQAVVKENPHKVDARELYSMPNAQVMHLTLLPGDALKPHKTPVDVFFYILEGSPTVHIGDESLVLPKDTIIDSPKDVMHYLSNETSELARILVVKTPNPQVNRTL
jgi:mannose-6-phosphate isomerase-like protein (cupin superfamily)